MQKAANIISYIFHPIFLFFYAYVILLLLSINGTIDIFQTLFAHLQVYFYYDLLFYFYSYSASHYNLFRKKGFQDTGSKLKKHTIYYYDYHLRKLVFSAFKNDFSRGCTQICFWDCCWTNCIAYTQPIYENKYAQ
jgi:hypothetical protein